MRVKRERLTASAGMLIVGHSEWEQPLFLSRDEEGYIHHPDLQDGIWIYPIIESDVQHLLTKRPSRWNLPPGDWTVLYGATNEVGPVETRDCPGCVLTIYEE